VLVPLAEITPDFVHPVLKLTSVELLALCGDKSEISKLKNQEFLPKQF
jgi:7,8-dihydro-6-hydroxymethylpterin-pyrophosphokinase